MTEREIQEKFLSDLQLDLKHCLTKKELRPLVEELLFAVGVLRSRLRLQDTADPLGTEPHRLETRESIDGWLD